MAMFPVCQGRGQLVRLVPRAFKLSRGLSPVGPCDAHRTGPSPPLCNSFPFRVHYKPHPNWKEGWLPLRPLEGSIKLGDQALALHYGKPFSGSKNN